jgi:hypothetical protein
MCKRGGENKVIRVKISNKTTPIKYDGYHKTFPEE